MIEGLPDGKLTEAVASGKTITVPCGNDQKAESGCEGFTVLIKDAFNQTITRGIDDANLTLSVTGKKTTGEKRYAAVNGKASIDNLQAHGIKIASSRVTIHVERDTRINTTMVFSTRECYPGEIENDETCEPCPSEKYSFYPNDKEGCMPCEENAICKGNASLVPKDGFWHSTPFSPLIKECFLKMACTSANRTADLQKFHSKDPQKLKSKLEEIKDYSKDQETYLEKLKELDSSEIYPQCNVGYEGILCGSCRDGYGHSLSGECEKCPGSQTRVRFLLALAILVTFIVIGVNCTVTLLSSRARIQLVRYEQRNARRPALLVRVQEHIRESDIVRAAVARRHTVSGSSIISDAQCRRILTQQLVSTVQLTETLKILVNYLQVTSAAARLPVDWQSVMRGLLAFQGKVS